jgi:large conductance mechanosensitive channel
MSFLKEFRDFAIKGNVIELAVAVVIGAAFGDIVNSLVAHILTPLILAPATKAAGVADIDKLTWGAVKYGTFLAAIIKFVLISLSLFIVVKGLNKVNKKQEEVTSSPEPSNSEKLLMEIRDQLSKNNN